MASDKKSKKVETPRNFVDINEPVFHSQAELNRAKTRFWHSLADLVDAIGEEAEKEMKRRRGEDIKT